MAQREEERFFPIGQVAKATGIPRHTLANACASGRIPFKRSPSGYRLISEGVVEQLRTHGLAVFPRPAATASSEGSPEDSQSPPLAPAERLGLLGEPSKKLQAQKEATETAKMQLEQERVDRELERLRRERQQERAAMEAEQAARWAEEETAAEREHRAQVAQQEEARREEWLKGEMGLAEDRLRTLWLLQGLDWNRLDEVRKDLTAALTCELAKTFQALSPDSSWAARESARQVAMERALKPYLREHKLQATIRSVMSEIPRYLRELQERAWINVESEDVEFLARRLEPRVRAFLEAEGLDRELSDTEAEELIRHFIDEELRLA